MRGLLGALAALALGGCIGYRDVVRFVDESRMVAKIGVVGHPRVSWAKDAKSLAQALDFFQSEKVDAVVLLGELTEEGYMNNYRELAALWRKKMPPSVRLIAVRGPEEDAKFDAATCVLPDTDSVLLPPSGGDVEVCGYPFHVSYAKRLVAQDGLLSFCSMGRLALTDELCCSPRAALSVNCGSLRGLEIPPAFSVAPPVEDAAQGLLVKVYSSEIEIQRLDFGYGLSPRKSGGRRAVVAKGKKGAVCVETVAPPWRFGRDADGKCTPIVEDVKPPQFWPDTQLQVVSGTDGHDRAFIVRFPQVLAKYTGTRAFSYEVSCGGFVQLVLPYAFQGSEERATLPVECVFTEDEVEMVPGQALTFSVTPLTSLGVRGEPISATVTVPR